MPQTQFNGPARTTFTGNQSIDAILWGWQWSSPNLTYRFPQSVQEYGGYTRIDDFTPFNPIQQQQIVTFVLNNLSTFSNLTFTPTNFFGDGNIRFAQSAILDANDGSGPHFPGFGPTLPRTSAEAFPPDQANFPSYTYGDNWYSNGNYTQPVLGSFQYAAGLLHEMGHAIGLSHGHIEQDVAGSSPTITSPKLPDNENSQEYSVMTYSQFVGQTLGSGAIGSADYPWTYMLNDVAAIQHMYGANFNSNNGNTTYQFDPNTGVLSIDGFEFDAPYRGRILATMWDGGGNDTYDFSNHNNNQTIDLNPGGWSTFSVSQLANLNNGQGANAIFAKGNLANAYLYDGDLRSLIENVNTGNGADTIIGNQTGNIIRSGGGNDIVDGRAGNDTLIGGAGNDFLTGGYGTDSYDGGSGQDTVTFHGNVGWTIDLGAETARVGSITETLVSIENAIGGNGDDHITGSSASNRLFGSNGDDTLIGGAGIDRYYGGSGSDTVSFAGAAGWVIDLAAGTAVTLTGGTTEILNSIENIIGSDGNDRITGTNKANKLDGGGGNDILDGGGGIDDFYGGSGFDTVDLSGGNSKWRVDLAAGTAELTTATGNVHSADFEDIESVIGPRNSMTFIGTDGNEKATGSYFADIFYARGGVDEFHGGNGSDTVSFGNYGEGLTIRGTAGYARLGNGTEVTTFTGIENIFATSEDDDITGTSGNNTIVGRAGADRIHGGSGDDIIQGDLGRDLLTGGRGNDRIDGGSDPNDYAFFSGNQNQYNISTSAGGVTTVAWIGPGAGDGTDTLTNIEFLGFDDGFFYL